MERSDKELGDVLRSALAGADAEKEALEAGASEKAAHAYGFAAAKGATKCPMCGLWINPGDVYRRNASGDKICERHRI